MSTSHAMIVDSYCETIRECEALPFFLHILARNEDTHLHYPVTRVILAAVRIKVRCDKRGKR